MTADNTEHSVLCDDATALGTRQGAMIPSPFASMPLPSLNQYPANLVYAQSMLAISMSQLNQVEMRALQLRVHLRDRQAQADLAAALAGLLAKTAGLPAANLMSSSGSDGASVVATPDAAPASGGHPAGGAGAPAAAEAPPQADRDEQWPIHRRRFAAAVKLAILMVVLDFRASWYLLYFFAVFLYVGGLFDPIIRWFSRPAQQLSLEQQLLALRRRQQAAEVPARGESVTGHAHGQGASDTAASASSGDRSIGAASDAPGSTSANSAALSAGQLPRDASDGDNAGTSATAADTAGEGAAVRGPQPSYAVRCFYQLVVMFFMTLLPWWNPNPNYL
eukprot:TRINITY_DN10925_c0_g1_i1.p1 TRINITY_DN10925_c0_g1~~TRINITY_DN10925_c0_g1_i1.p1  ORF type:complete len:335 (-),score=58.25 TRINITY_DN10925_c0_g1_i1:85-1089(-)